MAHHNPFRGFVDMMSEMDRMRRLGKSGHDPRYDEQGRTQATAWVPAADIYAAGADLVVRLELPGIRVEDVDIVFADGVLTISGARATEPVEEVTFYARERYHGPFRRSMILPDGVDEDRIGATFSDGVAEIIVRGACALAAPEEPRRIPIVDRSTGHQPLTGRAGPITPRSGA